MKKAVLCTLLLWSVALFGYAQSFSVPMPKGLQCSNMPTWPLTHSKKPTNLQLTSTSKNAGPATSNTTAAKTASAVPAIPLIKLWLMTEDDN